MAKDLCYIHEKKRNNQKITMLTCYDYPTAVLQDKAGIDVVFVGDSLGTNELGYENELSVTLGDMIHHLEAVRRGVVEAYLLVDMPFKTYETPDIALSTAKELIRHGADGVKLEGMQEEIVAHLRKSGIEVCGHLGFNPQYHGTVAVQGKTFDSAKRLVEDAIAMQKAGACMMVLELVPEELGKVITEKLAIPTIGIGAGRFTDGQILIVPDLLGITPRKMHHVRNYANVGEIMLGAFKAYISDVENGEFPQLANVRNMKIDEREQLLQWHHRIPD